MGWKAQLEVENARLTELLALTKHNIKHGLEMENKKLKEEVSQLKGEYLDQEDRYEKLVREYKLFEIMTHLIHNGMEPDMAKIMAVSAYNITKKEA